MSDKHSSPSDHDNLAGSLREKKILVVDDNHSTRRFLTAILRKNGALLQDTDSVQNALGLLRDFKPDVVVSDICMTPRSGYDLIHAMRNRRPDDPIASIPAIAISSLSDEKTRQRVMEEGFLDLIAKPFRGDEIVQAIVQAGKHPARPL